jgi:hypothetical protein
MIAKTTIKFWALAIIMCLVVVAFYILTEILINKI